MLVTLLSPVLIVLVAPGVKDSAFPDLHDQQRQTDFLFVLILLNFFNMTYSEQLINLDKGWFERLLHFFDGFAVVQPQLGATKNSKYISTRGSSVLSVSCKFEVLARHVAGSLEFL